MKLKWGIPICLLMVLLILGFFARAEIQSHFIGVQPNFLEKTIFTNSAVDVYFNESKIIEALPVPAYTQMQIAPENRDWKFQTLPPLVDYLKFNNEKVLKITGHFLSSEGDVHLGGYVDLGEARAGFLKQELIAAGIAAPRILITSSKDTSKKLKQVLTFECFNDSKLIP